ncbi:MAG: S8/S53 family peptidase [Paludibacteraceae bacterium]
MNKFIVLLITMFFFMNLLSQELNYYYVRITNKDIVPITIAIDSKTKILKLKSRNDKLNKMLEKYRIKQFYQAFPTAPTSSLQEIYYVECQNEEFKKEMNENFPSEIPEIDILCTPQTTGIYVPNDYSLAMTQSNLDLINAKEAWDYVYGLPKIPLAVTDTYFELDHEDLINQVSIFGGSNSNNSNNHGTAVAGLLSTLTDNNLGLAGLGLNSKIYASTNWASDNEVLRLAQAGYRVINCSWINNCTYSSSQAELYDVIKNVYNCVVVFGAGNGTNHCGSLTAKVYPASYSSVLSVTSVGHKFPIGYLDPSYNNIKWEWEDCHEEVVGDPNTAHHHNEEVDICAPGYCVPTTYATSMNSGKYGNSWGTSFAAPQVAATVGLVLSVNPCLTATQAMNIVVNSSDTSIYSIPENVAYIGKLGHGRLDVKAAVQLAVQSATIVFSEPINFTGVQTIVSNYAIRAINQPITISPGANITFKTRREVELNSGFEVKNGAIFEINVDPNNPIVCQ